MIARRLLLLGHRYLGRTFLPLAGALGVLVAVPLSGGWPPWLALPICYAIGFASAVVVCLVAGAARLLRIRRAMTA